MKIIILKSVFKLVVIAIIFLSLTNCKYWHSKIGMGRPASTVMELNYGPEIYRKGYKEGCESGYSGYGNNFNKFFFTWKQDPKLVLNKMYYQVWKDAYAHCAYMAMINDEHGLGNWR